MTSKTDPAPKPDDSARVGEAQLELTQALGALLGPLDKILQRQDEVATREAINAKERQRTNVLLVRLAWLFVGGIALGALLLAGQWVLYERQAEALESLEGVRVLFDGKLATTPADVASKVDSVSSSVATVKSSVKRMEDHTQLGGHPELEDRVRAVERRVGIKPPKAATLPERVERLEKDPHRR